MHRARRIVSEMMADIDTGSHHVIERDGEKVAMVVPWDTWLALNQTLKDLERRATARSRDLYTHEDAPRGW